MSMDQRYYSNQFGRFMTPDPYRATATSPSNPRDPQSWNRYAYAGGDPTNRIDPSGQDWCQGDDLFCFIAPNASGPDLGQIIYGILDWASLAAQIAANITASLASSISPSHEATAASGCDIDVKYRPIPGLGLVANHAYIEVTDRWSLPHVIEGKPEHSPVLTTLGFDWGHLVSSSLLFGGIPGDHPATDKAYGPDLLGTVWCDKVDQLLGLAANFKTSSAYDPLNGPNSNSLYHWFVSASNLSGFFPGPPPLTVGWGAPIPDNPILTP